jgi:hypothetical protein
VEVGIPRFSRNEYPATLLPSLEDERWVRFYLNQGPTTEGYRFAQIMSWGEQQLEETHNYIQWLFPIRERSPINPNAPVMSYSMQRQLKNDKRLRGQMTAAFIRMLWFWGIEFQGRYKGFAIPPGMEYRTERWCTESDHNQLRMSRMLECMSLVGFYITADLYDFLEKTMNEKGLVHIDSVDYWRRAVGA